MSSDLEALKGALTRQLDSLEEIAQGAGLPVWQLLTPAGELAATPVLVALANVEIALLAQQHPAMCGVVPSWGDTYPCVLLPGHPMPHADRDGDEWHG